MKFLTRAESMEYIIPNLSKYRKIPLIRPPVYKPPPNIDPSNLSFVRIYAQGVLTGFCGMSKSACRPPQIPFYRRFF